MTKRMKKIFEEGYAYPEFLIRMLRRFQMDCEYYLGASNGCSEHLWSGNVTDHIDDMKALYESIKKPLWITMEEIENYEKKMIEKQAIVNFKKVTDRYFELNYKKQDIIEKRVLNYLYDILQEYSIKADILDIILIGSRSRGLENKSSDLDIIVLYKGDINEDDFFNLLSKHPYYIDNVLVDFNPKNQEKIDINSWLQEEDNYLTKKSILQRVEYRILPLNYNRPVNLVCKEYLTIFYGYIYKIDQGYKYLSFEDLSRYKISFEELDKAAYSNSDKEFFEEELTGVLDRLLFDDIEFSLSDNSLHVLSNNQMKYGASILLYKDYFRKLANRLDSNLYILPSSIHEVLAFPEPFPDEKMIKELKNMVHEINQTEVRADEVLSNHIFLYLKDIDDILVF